MFFEADEDQIARLDSLQLVQLMKRLLLAECRMVDIPLRAVTVPLQITVPDGGEDGRVDWTGGADSTDFIPGRFSVFQSKAQNLTETLITAEVLKKPKKGPAQLNAVVSEALSRHGCYIIFCSHKFGGQKIKKLRSAVAKAIRKGKKKPSALKSIEIYDANRIANWVNAHPPVALWLANLRRQRSLAGFLSHEAWGRAANIKNIPWIADDSSRFSHNNIIDSKIKLHGHSVWPFQEAATAALDWLVKDQAVLRIAGPSGFGKSRFAFEMFNRQTNLSDDVDRTVVIYADLVIVGDEVAKLALEIADAGSSAILVVDDCPDEFHSKLADITHRAGSRLRLVTIDIETKVQDTLVIRLEPASDKTIGSIASAVSPTLTDSDSMYIQEFAKGFPQMAVLAARQNGMGRQAIRSAEQVLDRVVWGRSPRIEETQKALEVLSLFEWVGFTGRAAEEGRLIAEKLAGMTHDSFIERIKSFSPRGVVIQRDDFVQVLPIPLAASLAAKRLTLLPQDRLLTFFLDAPESLRNNLLRRFRWLDTSEEARAFARALLAADHLGNLQTLNTNAGAECLDNLVHVDPDLAMTTIQRVFGELTAEELKRVTSGRRHLVWALEKLAFRKASFDSSATFLRRLAASETEGDISNNATGQFTQLYQLYLSGTEAPPEMRLLMLDEGLASPNPREREVCIVALNKMLETGHYSRGGGAEQIGSERLKDWAPNTYGEIWEFLRAALKRLMDIALSDDPLSRQEKNIIGAHIRGLIGKLPFEEIKATISQIVSRDGFWPNAVEKVNEWLYFNRKEAPEELGRAVRTYFDEMMPVDPVELAILYTNGWQSDFHDPDIDYDQEQASQHDFEYATRKAIELTDLISRDSGAMDRTLERFIASEGKAVFPFARRLAELAPSATKLFKAAVDKVDRRQEAPNLGFFGGLIAGADSRDPQAARDCIRIALDSPKLKKDAIAMIGSSKLQRGDIALVVSLLKSGDIKPWQCATLSYGKGMAHLAGEDILPLLRELSQNEAAGLLAVIEIITMLLHGDSELSEGFLSVLQAVLVDPRLFDGAERNRMMGYNVERVIKYLARRDLIKVQFAKALVEQLLSICNPTRAKVFHELSRSIRDSLKVIIDRHPREVWTNIVKLLGSNDFLVRHRIEGLVMSEHDDYMGPGFLFAIPADIYLEWARKDSAHRASVVMRWLPITMKTEGDGLAWHPALHSFVKEFGNEPTVLGALASRLHPRTWYSPLKPHIEPQIKLLESWATHPQPKVRQWARERITWINSQTYGTERKERINIE